MIGERVKDFKENLTSPAKIPIYARETVYVNVSNHKSRLPKSYMPVFCMIGGENRDGKWNDMTTDTYIASAVVKVATYVGKDKAIAFDIYLDTLYVWDFSIPGVLPLHDPEPEKVTSPERKRMTFDMSAFDEVD